MPTHVVAFTSEPKDSELTVSNVKADIVEEQLSIRVTETHFLERNCNIGAAESNCLLDYCRTASHTIQNKVSATVQTAHHFEKFSQH